MTNQTTNSLKFPTVAESFCPQGTIAQVFNQFIGQYLNNGTVDIGGGQVTPQEITAINSALVNQQNEITALTKVVNRGSVTITTGSTNNTISFSTSMPSANYDILIEFIDSGTATVAPGWATISATTTGMVIRTYEIASTIESFNYTVTSY